MLDDVNTPVTSSIIDRDTPPKKTDRVEIPPRHSISAREHLLQQEISSSELRDRAWVEIDLAALAHNVRQVKRLLSVNAQLMAVVKADAYGHGAVTVAQTVLQHGATWLGVATIGEGIELRKAGVDAPIIILGATHSPEQIRAIAHFSLQPTLVSPQQAQVFEQTLSSLHQSIPVHVKLDTGMSRLGVLWQQAEEFVQFVSRCPHLRIASIYSHLATADSPDPRVMQLQQQRFENAIANLRAARPQCPSLRCVIAAGEADAISVEEGLSQSTTRALAQDGAGNVWVGTIDGLNRLDAHSASNDRPQTRFTSKSTGYPSKNYFRRNRR